MGAQWRTVRWELSALQQVRQPGAIPWRGNESEDRRAWVAVHDLGDDLVVRGGHRDGPGVLSGDAHAHVALVDEDVMGGQCPCLVRVYPHSQAEREQSLQSARLDGRALLTAHLEQPRGLVVGVGHDRVAAPHPRRLGLPWSLAGQGAAETPQVGPPGRPRGFTQVGCADGDVAVDDIGREDPLPIQRQTVTVGPGDDLRQRAHHFHRAAVVLGVQVVRQGAGEAGDRLPILGTQGLGDIRVDAATRHVAGVVDATSSGSAVWAC